MLTKARLAARRKAQKLSVTGPCNAQIAWEKQQAKTARRRERAEQIYVNSADQVFVPFPTRDGVKQRNGREKSRQYRRLFYDQVAYNNGLPC